MFVALAMAGAGSALHAQGPGGGPGGPGGGNFRNMTPEQRQQMMTQMREQNVRRILTQANVTDTATADAVIAFSTAQADATRTLQEKSRALNDALRDPASTNEQIAPLLADYRTAVTAEKARRAQALTDLDAKVSYTKNARLDAALTLGGIIGDEASVVNGGGMGGGMGMGGRNRRGGQGQGN
jgi:hypothetical protein